jgi:predicted DNA-binding transcriptional regulator AlpA
MMPFANKAEEVRMRKRRPRGATFSDYYTRRELLRIFGVSLSTIARMDAAGELPPAIYFGGVKLYEKAAIDKWVQELKKKGKPKH